MKRPGLFIATVFFLSWWLAYVSQAADVTLAWNEVEGCKYLVHYGHLSKKYTEEVPTDDLFCKIALPPGIYYFAVTAEYKDCAHTLCKSEYSDEVSLMLSDKPEIATISLSVK